MKAKGGLWLAAVVALAVGAAWAAPEATVVEGDNLVEITGVNGAGEQGRGLRDAQRKAVEQGAGTFIFTAKAKTRISPWSATRCWPSRPAS